MEIIINIMRKSKSCEDIPISIRSSRKCTDINSNVLISNLIKTQPSKKVYELFQPNAYDLLSIVQNRNQDIQESKKFSIPLRPALRKSCCQEDMDRLLRIQQQLKTQALNSLCQKVAVKRKQKENATPKELAALNSNNMGGRMKRSGMVRQIMVNASQAMNKKKQNKKEKNMSESQLSGSQINGISSSMKSSFQQDNNQENAIRIEKTKKFQKSLSKAEYTKVLNTERRMQAWKAFHEAERTKIATLMSEKHRNAYIKLNNDIRKKTTSIRKANKTCQDEQPQFQKLNYYHKFSRDFEFLIQNFKLGQR